MSRDQPVVSVGLPTYNRASMLRRAIDSVLAQDYSNLELVISDNGSIDDTQRVCEEFCARDDRVRYIRHLINRGPRANFLEVLEQSRGEFFLCLGDDDWLDKTYVSLCAQELVANPDYALVCGSTKYYLGEQFLADGVAVNLLQDCAEERMLAFYKQVHNNPAFYGVMRRELVPLTWSPRPILGYDLLMAGGLAFMGKIKTINETSINVSYSGMSRSLKEMCANFGISGIHALMPRLSIAISASRDVAWGSEAYASLSRWARLSLAKRLLSVFFRRALHIYWAARPIRSVISVRDKIRKKCLG